jgi:membrane protein implicated in regulation of membrane protease activity
MQETSPTEPRYEAKRKLVVYQMRPSTPFGRALAFVVSVLLLVAALFVSLAIFSILFTVVLFLVVYAWWRLRRVRAQNKHNME